MPRSNSPTRKAVDGFRIAHPSFRDFDALRARFDGLTGADWLDLFESLPEHVKDAMWQRERVQIDDRRFANGSGPFVSRRPKRTRRSAPARSFLPSDEWRRGTEALASIPAETYLSVLVPDTDPNRGKCHCPLPDHDDNNPSCTYKDSVWYCHVCATGGGIFQLGSALSGLGDHGDQFGDLRCWLADRMLGVAA